MNGLTFRLRTWDPGQPHVLAAGIPELKRAQQIAGYCLAEGYQLLAMEAVPTPMVAAGLARLINDLNKGEGLP